MSSRVSTTQDGIQFVASNGRRSSQAVGQAVFSRAARFVDASLADRIEAASNWRKEYLAPTRGLVELGTRSDKDALRIAADGLEALYEKVEWVRGDHSTRLDEAIQSRDGEQPFATAIVEGRGKPSTEVVLPYRGELLRGDALRRQLDKWQQRGVIEPSCAGALELVMSHPDWLDLSDLSFALLGAASEMGPLPWLFRWGATVAAIDLPREPLWERIVATARDGSGKLIAPTTAPARDPEGLVRTAGTDLLSHAPEVARWLFGLDRQLVLGNYLYADGERFVRLTAAADAVTIELDRRHRLHAFAYLATPTDVFAVPADVVEASRSQAHGRASPPIARVLSAGRLYQRNYERTVRSEDGREWGIFDCLVPQQGANYALAKTLQRWRALTLRESRVSVSANVAPATRTRSVLKNRILAAAYAGADRFGVEVFEPPTSSALEATLLVHDLRNPKSASNPATSLSHVYELFVAGAAHGGLWRLPHAPRSVLPLAVLSGLARRKEPTATK